MFYAIVVLSKRGPRVVWWIDEHALDLTREFLLKSLQRQQIVAEDEPILKDVGLGYAAGGVVGFLRIFEQDARLQAWPVLLADPGEFELLLVHGAFRVLHQQVHVRISQYPGICCQHGNSQDAGGADKDLIGRVAVESPGQLVGVDGYFGSQVQKLATTKGQSHCHPIGQGASERQAAQGNQLRYFPTRDDAYTEPRWFIVQKLATTKGQSHCHPIGQGASERQAAQGNQLRYFPTRDDAYTEPRWFIV